MPRKREFYTITETDPNVTLSANTANVETEIINYRCPQKTAVNVYAGTRLYLLIKDTAATPVQITVGKVRIYKAPVDKESHRSFVAVAKLEELDAGGTPEDTRLTYRLKQGTILGPMEYLIFTLTSADVLTTANTELMLDIKRVMEFTM